VPCRDESGGATVNPENAPCDVVSHLQRVHWRQANRNLIRKALAEFSHERLLHPESLGANQYRVGNDDGTVEYRFTARQKALQHWRIDQSSMRRTGGGCPADLDLITFILEFRNTLGLNDAVLPMYLEELSSTLSAAAYRLALGKPTAAALVT